MTQVFATPHFEVGNQEREHSPFSRTLPVPQLVFLPGYLPSPVIGDRFNTSGTPGFLRLVSLGHSTEIGRIKFLSVSDQGMLPKSHSCLGRKRLGRPRQVPRHWQASLRQDLLVPRGHRFCPRVPFSKFARFKSARVSRVVLWCCKYFSTAV